MGAYNTHYPWFEPCPANLLGQQEIIAYISPFTLLILFLITSLCLEVFQDQPSCEGNKSPMAAGISFWRYDIMSQAWAATFIPLLSPQKNNPDRISAIKDSNEK